MSHIKYLIDQKLKIHAMCQSKTFFVRYLVLPQQLEEVIKGVKRLMRAHEILPLTGYIFETSYSTSATQANKI